MKKLLLLLVTFVIALTLSACAGGDTEVQDSIDALEITVGENTTAADVLTTSLAALQTELDALETAVMDLEGENDDIDVLITGIVADIAAIEAELVALLDEDIAANETAIETLNGLVTALQSQIDALDGLVDTVINPMPMILGEKVTEIVIGHANDTHGRVNDDSWAGTMGMATIKNIFDALDAKYENTYYVAAGDMFHGTTFATLEEGESMVNVMNEAGWDLMVPGNHDFNYGFDRLLELEALADFDMVTANVQYDADDSDFMAPYIIQEFDGVKVGFFGLTTPETLYKSHPDNTVGLNFLDPITQATLMVAELEPLVDVIILVGHIGLDEDTSITTEDIATQVPGIDVIIDGHSHTFLPEGMMVGDTLIVSAGEYMESIGVFSLTVIGGEVVASNAILFDADDAEALNYGVDQDLQDYIDVITDAQDVILSEVVGQTAVNLVGERNNVRSGETGLGNLITDSMIVVTGADVAITNGGGIRASIPAGDVTLGDIITVLPFGNIIVTKDLTGQQILDTLTYATSSYPSASGKFPHVAGMTFDILYTEGVGYSVENLMIGGVAVDLAATYSVATNDFLAAGGDGYEIFATTPITGEFMGLHEALTSSFTVGVDIVVPALDRINTPEPVVFFSQYGDGDGGSCKFVELYNPTMYVVDLTQFTVIKGGNGTAFDASSDVQILEGILAPGEVIVVGNPACFSGDDSGSFDASFPISVPHIESTVVGYINGDDAVGLFYGGVLVDTIGLDGIDPGSSWPVGNGNITDGTTANVGLIRVPTVTDGEPDWAIGAMEWIVIDDRDYTDVGVHTYTPAS